MTRQTVRTGACAMHIWYPSCRLHSVVVIVIEMVVVGLIVRRVPIGGGGGGDGFGKSPGCCGDAGEGEEDGEEAEDGFPEVGGIVGVESWAGGAGHLGER